MLRELWGTLSPLSVMFLWLSLSLFPVCGHQTVFVYIDCDWKWQLAAPKHAEIANPLKVQVSVEEPSAEGGDPGENCPPHDVVCNSPAAKKEENEREKEGKL